MRGNLPFDAGMPGDFVKKFSIFPVAFDILYFFRDAFSTTTDFSFCVLLVIGPDASAMDLPISE